MKKYIHKYKLKSFTLASCNIGKQCNHVLENSNLNDKAEVLLFWFARKFYFQSLERPKCGMNIKVILVVWAVQSVKTPAAVFFFHFLLRNT